MHFVGPQCPKAMPVFRAKTFSQAVNWCIAAEQRGTLEDDAYNIVGAETGCDNIEVAATFFPDRARAALLKRISLHAPGRPNTGHATPAD